MRIQLIHPGDAYSTADVYDGLCFGLRANGHDVHESRLDTGLEALSTAAYLLQTYAPHAPEWAHNAFEMAAARMIHQAAWIQPDLVIAVTGMKVHPSVPITLRKMGIPTALLCTESPYARQEQVLAPLYDHVFTHERRAVSLFGDHPLSLIHI